MPRKAKPAADPRANPGRVLTDSTGENQRVKPSQRPGQAPIHFLAW